MVASQRGVKENKGMTRYILTVGTGVGKCGDQPRNRGRGCSTTNQKKVLQSTALTVEKKGMNGKKGLPTPKARWFKPGN